MVKIVEIIIESEVKKKENKANVYQKRNKIENFKFFLTIIEENFALFEIILFIYLT